MPLREMIPACLAQRGDGKLSWGDDYRADIRRPQREFKSANKLSRTHATLLEALNRHRGKGQQKVTVEHVHVHQGGQAIIGNVEGGWDADQIGESTPPSSACASPMHVFAVRIDHPFTWRLKS
jgi:hypothetical protein